MAVADRCTVLRKGKCIGTVDVKDTDKAKLSRMMVGRDVEFVVAKGDTQLGDTVLEVKNLTVPSKLHKNNAVKDVTFRVRAGEIVCLAGIEGNGQTECVYALTGLEKPSAGTVSLKGQPIVLIGRKRLKQAVGSLSKIKSIHMPIRQRSKLGMSHIPEDRQKFGLVLDYSLEENLVLLLDEIVEDREARNAKPTGSRLPGSASSITVVDPRSYNFV